MFFFWMGLMVKTFRQSGTLQDCSDSLKISAKTGYALVSTVFQSARSDTIKPCCFLCICFLKILLACSEIIVSGEGRNGYRGILQ